MKPDDAPPEATCTAIYGDALLLSPPTVTCTIRFGCGHSEEVTLPAKTVDQIQPVVLDFLARARKCSSCMRSAG